MTRKPKEPEDDKNPSWVATFCDMMLLMVSFFIILIAFSTFKRGRVVQFVRGFQGSLNVLPGGYKTEKGDQPIIPYQDMVETFREPGDVVTGLKGALKQAIETKDLKGLVKISVTEQGVVLDISDAVLFDPGSADIRTAGYHLLDSIGDVIKASSFIVRIEGHADNIPISTEKFPSNWELSATRAVNVLRFFLEDKGIPSSRLFAVGYGEYQLVFPNDTPENRAKNRRVVLTFSKNPSEVDGTAMGTHAK